MILVTGGTGLVGAHLLFHLVRAGHRPKAIYRTEKRTALTKKVFSYYTDDHEKLFDAIDWVECDILGGRDFAGFISSPITMFTGVLIQQL